MRALDLPAAVFFAAFAACTRADHVDPMPAGATRASSDSGWEYRIPTRYDEDRFFAEPVLASTGEKLVLYLDTGGNNVLYTDVVARLGLATVARTQGQESWTESAYPEFAPSAWIPKPVAREGRAVVFDRDARTTDRSGLLGPQWFGARRWRMDYPARELVLLERVDPPRSDAHVAELGFQSGMYFPRIRVEVAGELLDLLFDTGANTPLTPEAHARIADGRAAMRATSFITNAVFERWRAGHPEWRVIEAAEAGTGQAMIEVPTVVVAGFETGPVWFTRRADANFHTGMSQWMDRRIEGALGGNALRPFRIVVDYPRAAATFERP